MSKNEIRSEMLRLRRETNIHMLKKQSESIVKQIEKDEHFKEASTVAIFYPMMMEVDLLDLLKHKKTFLFPKVHGKDLHFYPYHKDMKMEKSAFGVLEPNEGIIHDEPIDYMIVPALAVSKENHRIGYGKGFYDAFLSSHRPTHVYGVIYDFQEVEHIDNTLNDQKLDGYFKGYL